MSRLRRLSNSRPGEEAGDAAAFQLYDLEDDIGETSKLVERHSEIVASMKALQCGGDWPAQHWLQSL